MEITIGLLQWYDKEKRDLPWRHTKDPYAIWISEIMLQQTRVDSAIVYYHNFLKAFPDVSALAKADESEVLNIWKGLGYYTRARNMMRAAKIIEAEYRGVFPKDVKQLLKIPGVGQYTAGAIASIAYSIPAPAVDGNVLRVVTRICGLTDDIALLATKKKVSGIVEKWIDASRAGDFTQAMMELGALVCTPLSPKCSQCPAVTECAAYREGRTDVIPVKAAAEKEKPVEEYYVYLLTCKNGVCMEFREHATLLGRMWGLPMAAIQENSAPQDAFLAAFGIKLSQGEKKGVVNHIFTHKIWKMTVYQYVLEEPVMIGAGYHWVETENLHNLPIPTAFRKIIKMI